MILCTKCQGGRFSDENREKLICDKCGFEILINDNITILHPEIESGHNGMAECIYDDLISAEEHHFWMKVRRNLIKSVFDKYVSHVDSIIEIGTGTGSVTNFLINNGYKNIVAGDVHLKGLSYAKKKYGIKELYQFDLIRSPFYEHFDVVCMFDVLEHIDDDDLAVKNVHKMLIKGGKVIITVPAHMWLWNKQDAIASHRRRYEVDQLKALFARNHFKILKISSFFVSILPLLYLRTFTDRDDGNISDEDFKNRFNINSIINIVLEKILNLEVRLLSNCSLKYGGSIILVAEKVEI